jgi:WD40 repeat protein
MAIAPDGVRAVSGSNWIAQVWDAVVKGRALVIYRGHAGDGSDMVSLAWSPDGERVASGTSVGTVQVWDAATGDTRLTYSGHVPPGQWPITQSANAPILEVSRRTTATFRAELRLPGIQATGRTYAVYALAWSPDGTRIASGGWDRLVRIWDAGMGQQLAPYGEHNTLVTALDWSPDGGRIASGDRDGMVHIWPLEGAGTSGRSR